MNFNPPLDFFKSNSSYRGDVLLSLPNNWAEKTNITESFFAYEFKIEEKKLPNFSYSTIFTPINLNDEKPFIPYYLHSFVIYEDITNIMKSAKLSIMKDTQIFPINDNNLLLEPLYLDQNNYFYPFTFVVKSRKAFDGVFLEVLEKLIDILYGQEKVFDDDCDLKFYQMIKFSSNLFFLINNFKKPSPNTLMQYKLSFLFSFYLC